MRLLDHRNWPPDHLGGAAEVPGGRFATLGQGSKLEGVSKDGPNTLRFVFEHEGKLYDTKMELDAGYEVNEELIEEIRAFHGKPWHEIAVVNTDCARRRAETER